MKEIVIELAREMRQHDRTEMAFKTGIGISTINKLIANPVGANPTIRTIEALRDYLDGKKSEIEK